MYKNVNARGTREEMRRGASSSDLFLFLAGGLAVNSVMLWLIYRWIRSREESYASLTPSDAVHDDAGASRKISATLKDLITYYDQVQGCIQELKDDLAILRKEKRDFQEDMRSLEQKANEQGEALVSLRGLMETELKSTKESINTQLGRVIVFHDEIQEHKKRITDLESKVAKHSEELETLRHRENGHADDVSLL
ncbi:hypothetical protein Y032_0081g1475 [Ancylostoma ceylanicum]|uniref:Uncharacterized protein n=1 Tax=Ancylostoma ceylanicum TaxID=53326 RepID=A0A016TTB0_9BILA|nr:hypothetical protein Y032_0081g1475 [Ancylostoma ceylanicum]